MVPVVSSTMFFQSFSFFSSNNCKMHTWQWNISLLFLNGAMQWFSKCFPVDVFSSFSLVLGSCHKFRTFLDPVVSLKTKFIASAQEASLLEINMHVPTPGLGPICGSILCLCSSFQTSCGGQPSHSTFPTTYLKPSTWVLFIETQIAGSKRSERFCNSPPSFHRRPKKRKAFWQRTCRGHGVLFGSFSVILLCIVMEQQAKNNKIIKHRKSPF